MPGAKRPACMYSRALTLTRILVLILAVAAVPAGIWGCSGNNRKQNDFLIRVGAGSVSVPEFNRAVAEAGEEAFPGEALPSGEALAELRARVMNQLTEEMLIAERGRQLGLTVTPQEVDQAVAAIKADYPDNTFEETLLENAVSPEEWRRKMAQHLLVQKVIDSELIGQVQISREDMAEYLHQRYPNGVPQNQSPEELNAIVVHLRRQKAEQNYKEWIEKLQRSIKVEINRERWEELLKNAQ